MIVLLPNLLSEELIEDDFLPKNLKEEVEKLDGLVAESRKSGIRYLLRFICREKANSLPILLLNEHTDEKELLSILSQIKKDGGRWGVISDAGLPCIADPGSKVVAYARENDIEVKAFSGPCSITLGLMLSGFNGQKFCFHGYLPRKDEELVPFIKKIEKRALEEGSTQIFIEAPYRSDKLLGILLASLKENVRLCVAKDLTMPTESVFSFEVKKWKEKKIELGKCACVFLFNF